jgi:hypothetical protein
MYSYCGVNSLWVSHGFPKKLTHGQVFKYRMGSSTNTTRDSRDSFTSKVELDGLDAARSEISAVVFF